MAFLEQWSALSARIRSLSEAGTLYALSHMANDTYGAGKALGVQCSYLLDGLIEFLAAYRSVLSPIAVVRLREFIAIRESLLKEAANDSRKARAGIVVLTALESELSFIFSDRQDALRTKSERAFLHLRRLLLVDEELRAKWKKAFTENGEVACEGLGSIHLLWHGLWAFKVDGKGARTDLIFNEAPENLFNQRVIEGLVLTEWKAADNKNAAQQFEKARLQAKAYAQGPLAGIELLEYRFVVVVSLSEVTVPDDVVMDGKIYRHINIVIEPKTPSKQKAS